MDYLEKIVQVSYCLPTMDKESNSKFIRHQAIDKQEEEGVEDRTPTPITPEGLERESSGGPKGQEDFSEAPAKEPTVLENQEEREPEVPNALGAAEEPTDPGRQKNEESGAVGELSILQNKDCKLLEESSCKTYNQCLSYLEDNFLFWKGTL